MHRDRRHYVPGRGCELCPLERAAGGTGWHVSRRLTPAFPPNTHTALGLHPCGLHSRPDGSPCGFSCGHCPAGSCQCQALLEASPHAICAQQTQALSASWQGPSQGGLTRSVLCVACPTGPSLPLVWPISVSHVWKEHFSSCPHRPVIWADSLT